MSTALRVSVRELVNFTMRSGDLDASFKSSLRATEGTRLHQKVQKSRGPDYRAEVPMRLELSREDCTLLLEGRADGILEENGLFWVEEIKSTLTPLEKLQESDRPLHWAQAQCYAYMLSLEGHDALGVRLTYIHAETEAIRQFHQILTAEALAIFMEDLIQRYLQWVRWQRDWHQLRNASVEQLDFPYPAYRTGQRELAVKIYKSILSGGRLFVQAPTGTGKTMSTLFPAIKALGFGHADKLFYLTARTTTQAVASEALILLERSGLRLKTVLLSAKEKICFLDQPSCNPEDCPYAKGHFDRVNDALMAALTRQGHDLLDRQKLLEIAADHKVCPFEMALDLALWADVILCDYNYVFDPRVSLKRFFEADTEERYVFLVDEAHHLVDRARDMFSASLLKSVTSDLKKRLSQPAPKVSKALTKVITQLNALKKAAQSQRFQAYESMPEPLLAALRRFEETAQKFLAASESAQFSEDLREALLNYYFEVLSFLRISELYGPDYLTYTESDKKELKVKLFCLHPKRLLGEALSKSRAAILFSATLHPLPYFRDVSGGSPGDPCLRLPSPFNPDHLGLYIYSAVSTRYKDRPQTTAEIARLITEVAGHGKPGHYLAFFPSYEYLRMVLESMERLETFIDLESQQPEMDDSQRAAFLGTFEKRLERSRVVFAVLGGLFSEGIDLTGDRLSGVIVVGVGLPQLHYENDRLKDYYEKTVGDGFGFAYQFPGMNKVLQAAGRVIRTETDRGVVLLIDDRFTHTRYRRLFPPEWSHARILRSPEALSNALVDFWSKAVLPL